MPPAVVKRDGGLRVPVDLSDIIRGVALHGVFEVAPFPVEVIKLQRRLLRGVRVVCQKAADADPHAGQAPRGIDAGGDRKRKIARRGFFPIAAGGGKKGGDTGVCEPSADAGEALRDENPVVFVEFDDVGHRPQGDEVNQGIEPRLRLCRKNASVPQFRPKRQKDVVHHAASGECLTWEGTRFEVGIDDAVGFGEHFRRKVMVGDENGEPLRFGVGNAFDARNSVVDRNDEIRFRIGRRAEIDDFRRQAVPQFEAVGDDVGNGNAERRKPPDRDGACRRTVAVVVGDDDRAALLFAKIGQQPSGFFRAFERCGRKHRFPVFPKVFGTRDAAGGESLRNGAQDA